MISGISAATSGLQTAFARFDRAAAAVVDSTDTESPDGAGDDSSLAETITAMMSARLAASAALEVARMSNEMLANSIDVGGYGVDGASV